jgi:hypothetical protein
MIERLLRMWLDQPPWIWLVLTLNIVGFTYVALTADDLVLVLVAWIIVGISLLSSVGRFALWLFARRNRESFPQPFPGAGPGPIAQSVTPGSLSGSDR